MARGCLEKALAVVVGGSKDGEARLRVQVFDEALRARLPNVARLAQAVLWHPKAVQVLRARLQPPAVAHGYAEGAANTWGPGPNPVEPLDWTFAAHTSWTGGAALPPTLRPTVTHWCPGLRLLMGYAG